MAPGMFWIIQLISISQVYVLNEIALVSSVLWVTSAMDVLYTAIDFISQLILVSVYNIQISLD